MRLGVPERAASPQLSRVDYEARFATALRRITAYMTPNQLRRESEKKYGLDFTEALEMAYENVRDEAKAALKGYRPKRGSQPRRQRMDETRQQTEDVKDPPAPSDQGDGASEGPKDASGEGQPAPAADGD